MHLIKKDFNVQDLYTNYTDNPKMLDYKNMNNKINTINYWSTEYAVAIVIIQIEKFKTLSKKLDNQKMFLFNKKCCKYFCDFISIGFIEVHWDLLFEASHTLCLVINTSMSNQNNGYSSFIDMQKKL